MSNFWLTFVVSEAMAVLGAFIASSTALTPAQKAAAEHVVEAGSAFLLTL